MFDVKEANLFELEEEDFDTVMASDITFTGTIRFAKPFMIKGTVNGNIIATSDLVIEKDAKIKADIEADRILIKGVVDGNVKGKRLVFITSTGTVNGDITSAQIVQEPGSTLNGKCTTIK